MQRTVNRHRWHSAHFPKNTCAPCAFRLQQLTAALLLAGLTYGSQAQAQDYFDPSFLSDGSGTTVDLSAYETEGAVPEGNYLVDIFMNQEQQQTQQIRFAKNTNGEVVPQLTPDMLKEMGVAVDRLPAFENKPADKPVDDMKALIPNATLNFDMASLRLDITVPQVDMDLQASGAVNPKLWDEGIPALLFNYNLSGFRSRITGNSGMPSSTSQSLFSSLNGGANLGAWRLRTTMNLSDSESRSGNASSRYRQTTFGDTYIQRDVQRLRAEMTLGESSTGSSVFDSIPFRGASLVSSDAMRPSSLNGFSPVISGTATSNARVTVSRYGSVIYETSVPPGPFRLTDIYSGGNGGDLVITVTEADGSQHISRQVYSTLPVMKRQGSADYELTVGRYTNGGYTEENRDPIFALATGSVGLPGYITLYGGLLGASGYQSLATGVGVSLGAAGALSVDATLARADLPGKGSTNGASFRARYSKSMNTTGTTVDLTSYRYATNQFYTFQDAMSHGYTLREGYAPWLGERERSRWQLSLSQELGSLGAFSLSAAREDYWGSGRVVNSIGAGFSSSIKGVGYSVNYAVDHTVSAKSSRNGDSWPTNRQLSLNVSVPFSIFHPTSSEIRQVSANYGVTRDGQGRVSQQAGINGNFFDNRMSWSASQSDDNQGADRAGNLSLGYSGSSASVGMGYGYASHMQTLNAIAAGGIVVHQHGISFTRNLGDSMALIEAPGANGVSVMGNGAETDSRGYAVASYLQDYQKNILSIDPTTLPDGVDVSDSSVTVYPTKGALVMAKFRTRIGRQAMLTLMHLGKPVPFGALATLPGDDYQSAAIVGDDGMVYLSGAPQKGQLMVQWGTTTASQCTVDFDFGPLQVKKEEDSLAVSIARQTLPCIPITAAPAAGSAEIRDE